VTQPEPAPPDFVPLTAFGREFRYLYPESAADLRALEDAGIVYSQFVDPGGNDDDGYTFTRYKITLRPAEIFDYVTARVAHEHYIQSIEDDGLSPREAIGKISDPVLRDRVREYARHAQNSGISKRDDYVCLASFYPPELENLLCGGRPDRYELVGAGDPTAAILRVLSSICVSARRLRRRRGGRPPFEVADEYDVQDLMQIGLTAVFEDAVREDATPMREDGHNCVDFCIPSARSIIEVKYVRGRADTRKISEELRADMVSYSSHPSCGTLFMYIYDPHGHIGDRQAYCRQFNGLHSIGGNEFRVLAIVDS
jgi:hypothetical protein